MSCPPPNIDGRLLTHVAAAENSRCAVQRVIDEVQRTLQTPLVIFTIASRPDVWRASAPGPCTGGATVHTPVTWQMQEHTTAQPCEGTLAWLRADDSLTATVGEGLLGLLRMAARLCVCQHAQAGSDDVAAACHLGDDAQGNGKRHFVQVAAHALRSPIMTLRMHIESLDRVLGGPNTHRTAHRLAHHLQRALGQCDALVGLSDNLLDVCTLQHAPLRLHPSKTDLSHVVHTVGQRFERHAAHAGCELLLDTPEPVVGSWDQGYLERAIANLIDNAIRYAPGAPITVRTRARADGGHLSVLDCGPGIAEACASRLFERFERGQSVLNSSGWGLGLYLTRHIVEAHGGQLRLERDMSRGCMMHLNLPVSAARKALVHGGADVTRRASPSML